MKKFIILALLLVSFTSCNSLKNSISIDDLIEYKATCDSAQIIIGYQFNYLNNSDTVTGVVWTHPQHPEYNPDHPLLLSARPTKDSFEYFRINKPINHEKMRAVTLSQTPTLDGLIKYISN